MIAWNASRKRNWRPRHDYAPSLSVKQWRWNNTSISGFTLELMASIWRIWFRECWHLKTALGAMISIRHMSSVSRLRDDSCIGNPTTLRATLMLNKKCERCGKCNLIELTECRRVDSETLIVKLQSQLAISRARGETCKSMLWRCIIEWVRDSTSVVCALFLEGENIIVKQTFSIRSLIIIISACFSNPGDSLHHVEMIIFPFQRRFLRPSESNTWLQGRVCI